jgi:hypothetical protein
MMDTMTVENKLGLIAAIRAGSRDTFEQARLNPFEVQLGKARYTFKEGLHERRAKAIIKAIHCTPANAFKLDTSLWTM